MLTESFFVSPILAPSNLSTYKLRILPRLFYQRFSNLPSETLSFDDLSVLTLNSDILSCFLVLAILSWNPFLLHGTFCWL